MKDFLNSKKAKIAALSVPLAFSVPFLANAETGGADVTEVISNAAKSAQADAVKVIGAAVGLGVVFWGAQVMWSKFKTMAK